MSERNIIEILLNDETIAIHKFTGEPLLSPETIEVIRELFKTHGYNYYWMREKYEQAQAEFNKVYGGAK